MHCGMLAAQGEYIDKRFAACDFFDGTNGVWKNGFGFTVGA